MVFAIITAAAWIVGMQGSLTMFWTFLGVRFNTAICLLLLSSALWLSQYPVFKYRRALLIVFPTVAALIAALSLSEYVFNINIGIDQLFVHEVALNLPNPGRMAGSTSIDLLFLGLGLLFLQVSTGRRWKIAAQLSFQLVTILSAIALIDDIYSASLYHTIFYAGSMDLHTSALFIVLSVAALLQNPSLGLVKLFLGTRTGDKVAKRLFVLIAVLVLVYGSARLQIESSKKLPVALTVSIMIVCFLLAMLAVVWYIAGWMNKTDDQRTKAEDEVKAINAGLEKRVEERSREIQKKEARYRLLIENASDAIYIVDFDGHFKDANNKTCQLLGYNRDELLQMRADQIVDPAGLETDPIKYDLGGEDTLRRERVLRRKNGSAFTVELNATLYPDETVLVIARDITERKQIEQKLLESEEQYRLLFYSSPMPKFIYELDTLQILDVNEVALDAYGYTRDEILNMTIDDLKPREDVPRIKEILSQINSYEEVIRFGVFDHLRKDRTVMKMEVSGCRFRFKGKDCMLVACNDVTEKEKAMEQLKELNESLQVQAAELKMSNSELEHFAYVASHDLQEPLRMITSFLTQLEKKYAGVLDDKAKQYIYFATDGAKRMRQLILDLLEYSRVGRSEDDLEDVNFNTLTEEVLALFRRNIEETNATVRFKDLPTMHISKTPLRQVFQNLVGNALKYHKPGVPPAVEITCTETRPAFEFIISDNGIGIDPKFFDQIFIIFKRLHNRDEYKGTGMGLAITKKIIEHIGGRIWVASKEGEGSAFHFTIPKRLKK